MLNELRMLIAETLLGWAAAVAPRAHKDGRMLVEAVLDYMHKAVHRRPGR